MATAEASTCGETRKEVVVSFMTSDSPYDASENTKMKILLTTSMSSSCGKVISFVDDEDKTEFMTLKPREITQIVDPEQKYLCLEYGPTRKAKFILLDFTDESREKLDEWNDFLCRMMDLEPSLQRRSTFNDRTLHTLKSPSKQRARSALLSSTPSCTASGSKSPEISDGDSTSVMSPFSSLESTEDTETYECPKVLLNQHQFKDYQDEIVVTQSVPDSKLHPGDTIALRTGTTPKNAELFREYIQTTVAPTIMLAVTPGVGITMKDGDQKLTIDITGQKRPDAVEAALKACNQSRLAIAEINGAPIPVGTHEHQVAQKLREALGGSTECHLHLIPRSLMTAETEVLDDEEPDIVQDAWPINVEGNSSVSGNTNTTGNEETEC